MAPGERERYRSGIYYLYRDLDLPVTPVATSLGLLWNRRDWRKKAGRCRHRVPAADRDRPRQADVHASPRGNDREGERPADRRVLRPALHALAARAALAGPDGRRPEAQSGRLIDRPASPATGNGQPVGRGQRPSRSPFTNTDRPTWRSRFSRSAVRIAFRLGQAGADVAVDDDVVVLRPVAHLVGRLGHALGDDLRAVLGAGQQPLLEVARRGRQDEDGDQVGAPLVAAAAACPASRCRTARRGRSPSASSTGARGVP